MPFGPNITISLHPLINDFFHWNVVCKGQKSNNIIIHMPWKILKKYSISLLIMKKQVYFMSSFSLFSQITIITHKPPCSETNTNSLFKLLSKKFPNLSSTTVSIFLPCTLGHFYFWTTHTLHFLNTQKPERDSHQLVATQVFREVWGRFWIILDGRRCWIYEKAPLIPRQAQKIWAK